VFLNEPAEQSVHKAAAAAEYLPTEQLAQLSRLENRPATHLMHSLARAADADPTAHAVHELAFAPE